VTVTGRTRLALAGALLAGVGALAGDAPAQDAAPVERVLRVARVTGDDAGDGSEAAPFRTLTRALARVRAGQQAAGGTSGRWRVLAAAGTYDAAAGETFPLPLPGGVTLQGAGAGVTIVAGPAPLLVESRLVSGEAVALVGLTLQGAGAGRGLLVQHVDQGGEGARTIVRDVACEGLDEGLRVEGPGLLDGVVTAELLVELSGVRATDCGTGAALAGPLAVAAVVRDAAFTRCGVGLLLEASLAAGPAVRETSVTRSLFEACREAGVRLAGGRPDDAPRTFSDCDFVGNDTGLELPVPAADAPLVLTRCRFLRNTSFGLRAGGQRGDPARTTRVEDGLFRWNGVGVHVTNVQAPWELSRCRIEDSTGVGLFVANFTAEPVTLLLRDSLVARNGAAGLYFLADGRRLDVQAVHCTIADNAGAGVERKHRHSGTSRFLLAGCLVAGNGTDLVRVEEAEVQGCLVGGDPGFVDRDARDWRLRAGSPALDRGEEGWPEGAPRAGERDVLGAQRRVGPIDLGAFELQAGEP
jgi:hypothetical protein